MYNNKSDEVIIAKWETNKPNINKLVPIMVESLRCFSTILPKKDAPIPKKKIPREKVNWTSDCEQDSLSVIGEENKVNA